MSEGGHPSAWEESILRGLAGFVGAAAAGGISLNDGRVLQAIPLSKLRPDPEQVRDLGSLESLQKAAALGDAAAARELASLEEMAASIREVGLQEPLGVEAQPDGDEYRIVHGHRRYLALLLAEAREAPCVVWPPMARSLRIRLQLVENLVREDLGEAEIYEAMLAYKKALATERGVPEEQVAWREVCAACGVTNENRKRIARLQRLALAAYEAARESRLSEWVLRPLLQHLQRAEEEEQEGGERPAKAARALAEDAQLRIVRALAAAEKPTAATTLALLREELGRGQESDLPMGRSDVGLRMERRWAGLEREANRLRSQWGSLTPGDRAALRSRVGKLLGELTSMLQELTD